MAFQTALLPVSLPTVATSLCALSRDAFHRLTCCGAVQDFVAATAEAWPSVANTVMGSWKGTSVRRAAQPGQAREALPSSSAQIMVGLC